MPHNYRYTDFPMLAISQVWKFHTLDIEGLEYDETMFFPNTKDAHSAHHQATCSIIERTGIEFPLAEADKPNLTPSKGLSAAILHFPEVGGTLLTIVCFIILISPLVSAKLQRVCKMYCLKRTPQAFLVLLYYGSFEYKYSLPSQKASRLLLILLHSSSLFPTSRRLSRALSVSGSFSDLTPSCLLLEILPMKRPLSKSLFFVAVT